MYICIYQNGKNKLNQHTMTHTEFDKKIKQLRKLEESVTTTFNKWYYKTHDAERAYEKVSNKRYYKWEPLHDELKAQWELWIAYCKANDIYEHYEFEHLIC